MTTFQIAQITLQSISAIGLIVTLLLAVRTLRLNVAAYRDSHDWNRRKAAHDAVAKYRDFAEDSKKLSETFSFRDGYDPITVDTVKDKVKADPPLRINVHRLLNFFEELATGIKHGVFDEEVVKSSLQTTISQSYTRFSLYVDHLRHNGRPRAFVECQAMVDRWRADSLSQPARSPTGAAIR